jgi:hypothetical protein
MLLQVSFTGDVGRQTAAAGTPIKALCPPRRGHKTRVTTLRYTAAATAHLLTAMRPLAQTTARVAALAGQAVVSLTRDPGTLLTPARPVAVNDWLAFEGPLFNGIPTFILAQVQAVAAGPVAGSLNVTLTANLPTGGIAANATAWFLGIVTDGHPQFNLPASATTTLQDIAAGFVGTTLPYQPLLLWVDNVTAAGTLENAVLVYTLEGGGGVGVGGAASVRGGAGAPGGEAPADEPAPIGILLVPADEFRQTRQASGREGLLDDPDWWNWDEEAVYYEDEEGGEGEGGDEGQEGGDEGQEGGQEGDAPPEGQPPGEGDVPEEALDMSQGADLPGGEAEGELPPPEPTPVPGATDPGAGGSDPSTVPPPEPTPALGASDPGSPPQPPPPEPTPTPGAADPGSPAQPPPPQTAPTPGATDPGAAGVSGPSMAERSAALGMPGSSARPLSGPRPARGAKRQPPAK